MYTDLFQKLLNDIPRFEASYEEHGKTVMKVIAESTRINMALHRLQNTWHLEVEPDMSTVISAEKRFALGRLMPSP